LSELETKATAGAVGLPMVKLVFGYDAGSRRVMKRVYANLGGTTTAPIWVLQNDVRFVYVGWHMIAEVEIKGTATDAPAGGGVNPPPFLRRSWLWGEDLTGTAPAAVGDQRKLGAGGGVGGLLAVTRHARGDQPAESYWATSDLNGNVIGLLATSSTKTAVYDYDPFGQPIRVNEPEAGLNPVRFSSKYTDAETGLCYYGYRYYSPELGRWLGRDPIGERGGLNLYGMVGNDGVGRWDVLGLNPVVKKRDCKYTVFIGHTDDVEAEVRDYGLGPCDLISGVACHGTGLNYGEGFEAQSILIAGTPAVPRYLYPNPAKIPKGYPDFDPEQDGDLDDYAFNSIANAEKQAMASCDDPNTCCKTVTVRVRCTQGSAMRAGWNNYRNVTGAFKNPCDYKNTFDCKKKVWSAPRIITYQTAHPDAH
jgi:RHS repeat-associated protein